MTKPRWVIETWNHEVLEVTNMYRTGKLATESVDDAISIVVRLPNGLWQALDVGGPIHVVQ